MAGFRRFGICFVFVTLLHNMASFKLNTEQREVFEQESDEELSSEELTNTEASITSSELDVILPLHLSGTSTEGDLTNTEASITSSEMDVILPLDLSGTSTKGEECLWHEIFWPQDGKCYSSNTKGPCAEGRWLVLHRGEAVCQSTLCKTDGSSVEFEGRCRELGERGPCPGNQTLLRSREGVVCMEQVVVLQNVAVAPYRCQFNQILDRHGNCRDLFVSAFSSLTNASGEEKKPIPPPIRPAKDECHSSEVFWKNQGRCYLLNSKGPCRAGQWLVKVNERPVCRSTPCPTDGFHVELDEFPGCHELGQQSPCPEGLILDRTDASLVECRPWVPIRLEAPEIGTAPRRCRPGQYLDRRGICRFYFSRSLL